MKGVRITAGHLRGRVLPRVGGSGVRPVKSIIREVVFSWLGECIRGLNVLDAFSGTGIMGFEAYSRGAASVLSLDGSEVVLSHLKEQACILGGGKVRACKWFFPQKLEQVCQVKKIDLVFWDPPYPLLTLGQSVEWLRAQGFAGSEVLVYVEWPLSKNGSEKTASSHVEWVKASKSAGVGFGLLRLMGANKE